MSWAVSVGWMAVVVVMAAVVVVTLAVVMVSLRMILCAHVVGFSCFMKMHYGQTDGPTDRWTDGQTLLN